MHGVHALARYNLLPLTRLPRQGVAAECGIQAMPTFQVRLVPMQRSAATTLP